MKLKWTDVCEIFEDVCVWENRHDLYWYRMMWGLLEYRRMIEYSTEPDKTAVLSRAFALTGIYRDFIRICFDDEDMEEVFRSSKYDIISFLYSDRDVSDIFRALSEELGTMKTFYSMFITCLAISPDSENYFDSFKSYLTLFGKSSVRFSVEDAPESTAGYMYLADKMNT